jgi:hypothetical protein
VRLASGRPWAALGLAVGPVAFVSAWALGGARMPAPYSPVDDAISRIAAVGSPEQALMTAGFLVYGAALGAGAVGIASSPLRRAWPLVVVNAVATVAVAATPLEHSSTVDALHGVAAGTGYVALAALPLVAAGPLRRAGHERAAAASVVAGVATALCLVGTTTTEANGLLQRVGLGIGDVWLIATGIALFRGGRRASSTS